MGTASQLGESPRMSRFGSHRLPQLTQAVIDMPRLGKTRDIALHQLDPVMQRCQTPITGLFGHQTLDRMTKGLGRKSGQNRSAGNPQWTSPSRSLVTDPGKIPALSRNRMEGANHMGRRQTCLTSSASLPSTIEPNTSFAAKADQEVTARQIGADHGVGLHRFGQPHVRNLVRHQDRTTRSPQNSFPSPGSRRVCFDQWRVEHEMSTTLRLEPKKRERRKPPSRSKRITHLSCSIVPPRRIDPGSHEFSLSDHPGFS